MNRRVLITGVSSGIGLAVALEFLQNGWEVLGVDRAPCSEAGRLSWFARLDLAHPEAFASIAAGVGDRPLHALVSNAAVMHCLAARDTSEALWRQTMDVNAGALMQLFGRLEGKLREARGSVVAVSSVHALATSRNVAAYAASKGALTALVRALALEAAPQVRVNAVLPGAVDTDMLRGGLRRSNEALDEAEIASRLAQLAEKTPLERIGRTRDIAQAVLFLADNERSSFITGQSLVVDGGALARLSTE